MLFKTLPTEFKFSETAGVMEFSGYASTFGNVDSYGDIVQPGAFAKSLQSPRRVLMRRNHFEGVIGKWTAMKEDASGLFVKGELTPGVKLAEDTYALLRHGAINGLSIGYMPVASADGVQDGQRVRMLSEVDLFEISVVDSPANQAATVTSVKSAIESATTLKELERLLRDVGSFSKADACALVSRIKSLDLGDPDPESDVAAALAMQFATFGR